ncbi:MAG: hypothetical protein Unbinned1693contig1002_30 [Prokaryotic dsDNA virus sp.]|jgi:hypothetical protein|nr:MAG: hypothetical protein Unbinned1693contig1002_30 [Prokaryotic dsDNA virus sp.]|tara:strand:+ start:6376 stop:6537 length:162 start_codon:yes stop_codon:yes gene_type:complete
MKSKKEKQDNQRDIYTAVMVITGIFTLGIFPLMQWITKRMIQNAIEDAQWKKK